MRNGFSVVELLIVVAIIGILAASSSPFFFRFVAQNNLETGTNKVVSTIRKAQSYAIEGKDNATWGFCMSGASLRLFSGSCSSPTFSEDFDLSGINVSGVSETTFSGTSGRRGEPSTNLTITLTNDMGSRVVTLNRIGGLDIN